MQFNKIIKDMYSLLNHIQNINFTQGTPQLSQSKAPNSTPRIIALIGINIDKYNEH